MFFLGNPKLSETEPRNVKIRVTSEGEVQGFVEYDLWSARHFMRQPVVQNFFG